MLNVSPKSPLICSSLFLGKTGHYSVSDEVNNFDSCGMTCFSTVVSDILMIRLYFFVELASKLHAQAFSELSMSLRWCRMSVFDVVQ